MIDLEKAWNKADKNLQVHGYNGYSGIKIKVFLREQQAIIDKAMDYEQARESVCFILETYTRDWHECADAVLKALGYKVKDSHDKAQVEKG